MDEFPNSDDEFELMYGDEFEVLRQQEEPPKPPEKSRKSLDFTSDSTPNPEISTQNTQDLSGIDLIQINDDPVIEESASGKRTIEELFGDIDDILFENPTKKHKGDERDADLALIEQIVELRKQTRERDLPKILHPTFTAYENRNKDNLSYSVPRYPFVGVTRHDGVRVYVRCHSEDYEKEEIQRVVKEIGSEGLLGTSSKEIWEKAQHLLANQLDNDANAILDPERQPKIYSKDDKDLWVDLYKPRKYFELLSDESTNRIMLKWIKLWDKCVFKRMPKVKIQNPTNENKFNKFKMPELNTELDEDGRPKHKVALLCGPPGLGKTTLAHMVARHAGYNIVEINASDDRNVEAFRTSLQNATQMTSVVDLERRPNCIIFDEIDGAPSASIDYLVKFVIGTATATKGKKGKKKAQVLKRPIICICNDPYVPSLRPLRQIAFVVNFPPISDMRLAERLVEVARRQQVKTDLGAMVALAQKTKNDIRACLSILHLFKAENKPVTYSEILKSSVGEKDMQKGLFEIWQDIFLIERSRDDKNNGSVLKMRMNKIVHVISSFGDYDRLAQGVFENYPNIQFKNTNLEGTCQSLDWFCFYDEINSYVYSTQNFSLSQYIHYAFVVWHFVFGTTNWQKLQYPSVGYEVRTKQIRQKALVTELMRGMQPTIRTFVQPLVLTLDILPLLSIVITPTFRPINLHLYTEEEKKTLQHVVNVMVDYNLNYVQERTIEGTYIYKLDPNIDELVSFAPKRHLSYFNKQLIAKEIQTAKMLKNDRKTTEETLPNHLQTLRPKNVTRSEKPVVTKDFFGRIKKQSSPKSVRTGAEHKHDVWYQYKEGYSNAVRKKIKISSLK